MGSQIESSKKVEISMRLSEFEMPPMQDVLVVGKRAPIGPEAARRMGDILSPGQYIVKKIEHPSIEAMVVRKSLLAMVPEDQLISLMIDEVAEMIHESMIVRVQINVTVIVKKLIEL